MDTVIVGAGQSGLALSYFLTERGIDHLLLERGRVAERWRSERWDSLRFQFPNAFVKLPDYQYDGDDASAFMHRDELVAWLDAYALRINAPVRCGVCVHKIARDDAGEWRVDTSAGDYAARNVVVATGPYQQPNIPAVGRRIPARVRQLPASLYTGPSQVGEGPILVVGSGASGGQIAEDLLRAGRDVTLAVGRHRRFPRRRAGRDIAYWLEELGTLDRTDPGDPTIPSAHLLSGIDGGQDLNLRDLQDRGLRLLGRLSDVTATRYQFADTLAHDLAVGDQIYAYVCALVDANINGTEAPPPVAVPPAPAQIDAERMSLDAFATVIWATGYHTDFSWVDSPAIAADGKPRHYRGVSEDPGLSFIGLPGLYKARSSFLWGAEEDAHYLAEHIASAKANTSTQ